MSQIQLGDLILIRRIASGGMAEVWEAKKRGVEGFEKRVAVKVILPHLSENQEFIQMFLDEGRLAAHLEHPNICQIIDLAEYNGIYYMAMEYIDGVPLNKILKVTSKRKEPIPIEHCCYIVAEACSALDYAHSRTDAQGRPLNLVHRDISPQNIMISYTGEVKILDFGIAKAATQLHHTRSGVIKGKYSYMSPEQATGQKLDNRSDIFALGIVLWELLTGKMLFKAENEMATLHRIISGQYPPPTKYRPECPPQLVDITMKALAPNREERFQTCGEFQIALEEFLDEFGYSYGRRRLAKFVSMYFPPEERKKLDNKSLSTGNYSSPRSIFDTFSTGARWKSEGEKSQHAVHPPPSKQFQAPPPPDVQLPSAIYSQSQAQPIPSQLSAQADVFSLPVTGEREAPKPSGKRKSALPVVLGSIAAVALVALAIFFLWKREPDKVYWTVVTVPEGATLSVKGKQVGKTPHTLEIHLGAPLHLKLSKEGYRQREIHFAQVTRELVTKPLYIRLKPTDGAKGDEPKAGAVPSDRPKPRVPPPTKREVRSKRRSASVRRTKFHKKRELDLELAPGSDPDVPLPSSYRKARPSLETLLSVETDPMGARVYLNGKFLGIAPLPAKTVEPGRYRLKIERMGFQKKEVVLSIRRGEHKKLKFELQPAVKKKRFSTVSIFSSPAAKVYIGGRLLGITPILNRKVKPGTYRIKWELQPYNSVVYTTERVAGDRVKIRRKFRYGELWLLSRPQADVYLNGLSLGKTNKPPYRVPEGEYRVMFSFPNGHSIIRIVNVKPKKRLRIAVKAR